MSGLDVAQVVRRIRDLPALPTIVFDLITSFARADVDVATLADKISRDQALAAKILRLANSSFYGLQAKVGTVKQAIVVLGFDSARALAVASSVIERFGDERLAEIDVIEFWRHSIATALCARALARHAGLSKDQAFIAGLLHDIGRLVLASAFPADYARVTDHCTREGISLSDAELRVLGVDHQRVGQLLGEAWRFPPPMQRAIGQHHVPAMADLSGLAGLIHAANAVVQALDLGCDAHAAVPRLHDAVWSSLQISSEQLHEACRETEAQFEEACQLLMPTHAHE